MLIEHGLVHSENAARIKEELEENVHVQEKKKKERDKSIAKLLPSISARVRLVSLR